MGHRDRRYLYVAGVSQKIANVNEPLKRCDWPIGNTNKGGVRLRHVLAMFVERKVRYGVLFTNLVRWHASAVCFPLSDVIFARLACPLTDIMFWLHSGITNLSLYKHCVLATSWHLRYPANFPKFWLLFKLSGSKETFLMPFDHW